MKLEKGKKMYQNSGWKVLVAPLLLTAFAGTALAVEDNREGISAFEETKQVTKKKKVKKEKHEVRAYAESGLGYDSNPYLTPSSPYIDYSVQPVSPVIQPDVKGGMFIPLFLHADYEYRYKKDIRFLADAKASGKRFVGSDLQNANEYKAEVGGTVRFRFNKYKKEVNRIDLRAFVGEVYEIYVDHDDGGLKTTAGGDQSNRYQYKKVGAELAYTYDFRKFDLLLRGKYEYRDYEDPDTWSSLDHAYYRAKAQAGYQFTKALHLGAYYEFRVRDYKERASYETDSNGSIDLVGPAGVVYTYNDLKLFGEYKFTKAYKMELEYLASLRNDDNQGYSDYLYHRVSWTNSYKFTKKLRSSLKLNYYVYDYKNAYAFNQLTTLDKLESSGYRGYFNTKYVFTPEWTGNFDLHYREEKSTDKRYEYEEMIAMATLKYRF